jgi:hypothetical protein
MRMRGRRAGDIQSKEPDVVGDVDYFVDVLVSSSVPATIVTRKTCTFSLH